MPPRIRTDEVSERYRAIAVDAPGRRLRIARISGSEQERDLSTPPNCGGFGRIRHFSRATGEGWPPNPLPIDPAARALGIAPAEGVRAQAFQNAVCNWRCWYCFVPYPLLSGSAKYSEWFTADELVALYLAEEHRPPIIDLTGGQPDLVPEWVPWMMQALRNRGVSDEVYLWSDDNLSNDYLRRYLSKSDLELMCSYNMYGRVGCFKGYDEHSFSFNTQADPDLFERQFRVMSSILELGLDTYAYATFTTPEVDHTRIRDGVQQFVDRLQMLDENLPLRTVPLEIRVFHTVEKRVGPAERVAMAGQAIAIAQWWAEIGRRYSSAMRERSIADIELSSRRPTSDRHGTGQIEYR